MEKEAGRSKTLPKKNHVPQKIQFYKFEYRGLEEALYKKRNDQSQIILYKLGRITF